MNIWFLLIPIIPLVFVLWVKLNEVDISIHD